MIEQPTINNKSIMDLTSFAFQDYSIRFVDDMPVASDIAKALGYAQPKDAVYRIVDNEYLTVCKIQTVEGGVTKEREVSVIAEEAGIYQLIFSSKLESAKAFQRWVFKEVLPSIRKTGSYGTPVKSVADLEYVVELLIAKKQEERYASWRYLWEQDLHKTIPMAIQRCFLGYDLDADTAWEILQQLKEKHSEFAIIPEIAVRTFFALKSNGYFGVFTLTPDSFSKPLHQLLKTIVKDL